VTDSGSDDDDQVPVTVSQPVTYADLQYWQERYSKNLDPFEWYVSWERLKPLLMPLLDECQTCLHVGCGTSSVGADLLTAGIERVVNVDFCEIVIESMKKKYSFEPKLEWQIVDVIQPTGFKDRTFDVIIDKATMDAQLCSDVASSNIYEMFHEMSRILKPRGYFIVISSGVDEIRRFFFEIETFDWRLCETMKIEKIPVRGTFYYVYIAQKNLAVDVD
jgi:ubiquinone/menaquinone biosynthesis C-methylase UbiE